MNIITTIGLIMLLGGVIVLLFTGLFGDYLEDKIESIRIEMLLFISLSDILIGLCLIVGGIISSISSKKYKITIYNKNDVVIEYDDCTHISNNLDGSVSFYSNEILYNVVLEPGQTIKSELKKEE